MILVELEDVLPPVNREFHVMQGELYPVEGFGTGGLLTESDGAAEALAEDTALQAEVGETIRHLLRCGPTIKTSSST